MSEYTVFYSWQSDSPHSTNRGLIGECLEKAITQIASDKSIELTPTLDRDTLGLPGTPDISQAIFEKIDACGVFVADLTLIGKPQRAGRRTPNPNVLIELGYAVARLGWRSVILLVNESNGLMDKLPFDIPRRLVHNYTLKDGEDSAAVKNMLVGTLASMITDILKAKEMTKAATPAQDRLTDTREKVENYHRQRTTQIDGERYGRDIAGLPRMILHAIPAESLSPNSRQFNAKDLREVWQYLTCPYGGEGDAKVTKDGFIAPYGNPVCYVTSVSKSGIIELVDAAIAYRANPQSELALCDKDIIVASRRSIQKFLMAWKQLGIAPPFFIVATYQNIMGVVVGPARFPDGSDQRRLEEQSLEMAPFMVDDYNAEISPRLKEWHDLLWNAAGYDGCPWFDENGKVRV